MSYLATVCDDCHGVSLVPLGAFAQRPPLCSNCHEALRVFPSCNYSAGDVTLFSELNATIAESGISAAEADSLALEISSKLSTGSYDACWERLAKRLPGLLPVQLVIGSNHLRRRRALQMFKTIFEALSTTRVSGMLSTPRVEALKSHA